MFPYIIILINEIKVTINKNNTITSNFIPNLLNKIFHKQLISVFQLIFTKGLIIIIIILDIS